MNTTQIEKSIRKWLNQIGITWQTHYLITTGETKQYLESFIHNEEQNSNLLKFTNEIKRAMEFENFDDAYRYTYLLGSCTNPIVAFVTEIKVKGKGKNKKIQLNEEIYFA